MSLSLVDIITSVAGIVSIFGLFGIAMYWLGVTRTKLNSLKVEATDLRKDVNDMTIRFNADLLARDLLDKYIARHKEESKK